jgi:hypothetical protein
MQLEWRDEKWEQKFRQNILIGRHRSEDVGIDGKVILKLVRFDTSMALKIYTVIFLDYDAGGYQDFRGICCLSLQGGKS